MLLTETGLFQNNEHIDAHSMAQISSRFPSSAIFRTLPFCFITASLYVNFTILVLGAAFTIFSVSSVFPTLTIQPNIVLIVDRHPSPLNFLRQRVSSRLIGSSSVGGRNRVCMANGTGCIRCFVDGIFYTPA